MELQYDLKDLPKAANQLLTLANEKNLPVLAFYGQMGVGKTTLIKEICRQLGVIDTVQSPTFAIVNQYLTYDGRAVYHFDFYRIEKLKEALDVGTEEILYSGELCLLEWPEVVEPVLPPFTMKIKIKEIDKNTRKLTIE